MKPVRSAAMRHGSDGQHLAADLTGLRIPDLILKVH